MGTMVLEGVVAVHDVGGRGGLEELVEDVVWVLA